MVFIENISLLTFYCEGQMTYTFKKTGNKFKNFLTDKNIVSSSLYARSFNYNVLGAETYASSFVLYIKNRGSRPGLRADSGLLTEVRGF